jgi:hypothetical protein
MPLPAVRDHVRTILYVGAGTDPKAFDEQLDFDKKVSAQGKNDLLDDLPALSRQARAPAAPLPPLGLPRTPAPAPERWADGEG